MTRPWLRPAGEAEIPVTVAEHCLQVATHWLRHPPGAYTVSELDELIVLSLFHDIHYYGAARPQSLARMRLQRYDALRDIPCAVLQTCDCRIRYVS